MKNSLESSNSAMESSSTYLTILTYIIISSSLLILGVGGGSIELMWAMINTLQIIAFLPLMTPFFPSHVRLMYKLLKFSNFEFEFLSDFFKKYTFIDQIEVTPYNSQFLDNEIESTLFLDICSSLISSFFLSFLSLLALVILLPILKCKYCHDKLNTAISSYFWNNYLRFITEGYLELSFGALLNLTDINFTDIIKTISSAVAICVAFI
jgi:hypothetical protein